MHKLTVLRGGMRAQLEFEGTPRLMDVLKGNGFSVEHPCGGRGSCGKCAVVLSGAVSAPNAAEIRAGARLSCQAVLLGDASIVLPEERALEQIETGVCAASAEIDPMAGKIGAAVDIGTTTIALRMYDLEIGACIGEAGMRNPQGDCAADVMGRIGAAMDGKDDLLRRQALDALEALISCACPDKTADVLVTTGNTTMLYLLTGRSPEALSRAPFEADCLFDVETELLGKRAYLPPCMHAFVGADISCAVLAAGQCAGGVSLLADIGTNGEIALWKDGTLYVSSTAAGPAFEGAGISCGCGSVRGAIDRVWLEDGKIAVNTIGGAPASGLCGSGLIDAIACFLENGEVDETGATDADELQLENGVFLQPGDIRAVQLAKAAIAAGIETIMDAAGVGADEIETLYIAGGFGSHLNVESAARIGLFPQELKGRVKVLGNAALAGAAMLLLDRKNVDEIRRISASAKHVNLGGNPSFNEHYMDQMFFPEE